MCVKPHPLKLLGNHNETRYIMLRERHSVDVIISLRLNAAKVSIRSTYGRLLLAIVLAVCPINEWMK